MTYKEIVELIMVVLVALIGLHCGKGFINSIDETFNKIDERLKKLESVVKDE